MMTETEILPLFPLGVVLFPCMVLPLHIFEDRYKAMISECLDQNKNFGMVYYSGDKYNTTGCSAEVINVIKKYDDGRLDIISEGRKRFHVLETFEQKPFLEAKVSYFDDSYETDGPELEITAKMGTELLKEIMKVYSDGKDFPAVDALEPKVISFLIASSSGFSLEEKQTFLEIINTRERLEKGVKSLQKIIERLIMTKEIEKIIQGNGYLPHKSKLPEI